MGPILDAFASLQAEAATYAQPVQVWMRVMAVSFFAGIVVAIWDRRALWAVGMALLTLSVLVVTRLVAPDIPRSTAGEVAQLVIWPVALWRLWRPVESHAVIFGVWRSWVSALILLSLGLDILGLLGIL